jgi:glyoxylase-like metal-dependent hydrolase (beta-lactamase superfamily II)
MSEFAKVHILHCGRVNVDPALPFREGRLMPAINASGWFRPRSNRVWLPVSAYLIEHPRGLVLIDTGLHEEVRSHPLSHMGLLNYSIYGVHLPEGQSIREQLAARGLTDRDLSYVVLTHLHADHVSGLKHVQHAQKIITSEVEWQARDTMGYVKSMWSGVPVEPFSLDEIPYGPKGLGKDLFGDGLIHLVFTPGHTRGQIAVLVRTADGYVLLASDVGYATRSFEQTILPGFTDDNEEAVESLLWVKEFSQRHDCIETVANHDPDVVPHTIG